MHNFEVSLKNFITEIVRPFFVFFGRFKKKNKEKINELINDYDKLIAEYKLIQIKESKLSKNEREMVVDQINFLIKKGHIKAKR